MFMINFPKIETVQYDQLHIPFFGKIDYSYTNNTFIFPDTQPKHAFYTPKTVPKPYFHRVNFTEVNDTTFVIGKTVKNFRAIYQDYAYKFRINSSAHTVKIMNNQVFYAANTTLYATHHASQQSLDIPSISMDITNITNEVILLQKGYIQVLFGPKYKLAHSNFNKILYGNHPRTSYLFNENGGYFIDLRSKNAVQVFGAKCKITGMVQNDSHLIVRSTYSATVIDKRMENKTMYTLPVLRRANINLNDEYLVVWRGTAFGFYKLSNMNENETQKYDIHDLVSFTTRGDKYYFFRRKKIEVFGIEKRAVFYYVPVVETTFKHADVDFFEKDVVSNVRCNDYFETDDLMSERFDEIMDKISKYGIEEKVVEDKTAGMKKVKRMGGF